MKAKISRLNCKYEMFKSFIEKKSGIKFSSFDNRYIDEQENYKKIVFHKAVQILGVASWVKEDVGTGKIVGLLRESIDQPENNLLIHDNRRGETARQDKLLLEAEKNIELMAELENVLFDFFKSKVSDEESFNKIMKLSGKIYPFLGFLFFLKSSRKYVPIAPNTFDNIFEDLGVDFRTSHKCSWKNYQAYLGVIKDVQRYLISRNENYDEVTLLDAHSFLWILQRQMKENEPKITSQIKQRPDFALIVVESGQKRRVIEGSKSDKQIFKTDEDYDKESIRKRIRGKESEEIVLDFEKKELVRVGRIDLSDRVVSRSSEVSLGYDVLSFDEHGNEKHIEVKTRSKNNCFWLTRNELEVSKTDGYYRIYVVDAEKMIIYNIDFKSVQDEYTVIPEIFKVYY
jgi:hypothetical protein